MSKLRIRQISESEFTVKGHGVHTAYLELTNALRRRTDTIVTVNQRGDVDITHIHTIGMYALGYLLFGSGKKVVSAHVVPASFVGSLVLAKYWLPVITWYIRWFYNRADLVIAVSDATKRELQKLGITKPIEVLCNMIDTSHYRLRDNDKARARQKLGIASDAWMVVGAGQVQPRKRVDSFVSLAAKTPDIEYYWLGGMPFGKGAADSGKMQRLMSSAPINVQFPGIVPLEDMKNYYHAADLFFLPSDQETFGLVVVEAAASGLPVLLRDIPDYKETFADCAVMATEATFKDAVTRLRTDAREYTKYKELAKKLAAKYDGVNGAEHAVALYRSVL